MFPRWRHWEEVKKHVQGMVEAAGGSGVGDKKIDHRGEYRDLPFYFNDEAAGGKNGTLVPEETWAEEKSQSVEMARGRLLLRNKARGESWNVVGKA